MRYIFKNYIYIFLGLFFLFSSSIGVFLNYSPVPFWDMWDGYLGFYINIIDGNYNHWLIQHNEHKILIPRILFYIDFLIFNGQGYFLLLLNLIFLIIFTILFFNIFKRFFFNNELKFLSILVCLIFFWGQKENLVWAFQSQFFLVYLFPFLSIYSLYEYAKTDQVQKLIYFLVFTFCAVFSMANGIVILPLILFFLCYLQINIKNKYLISIFIFSLLYLYLFNYTSPPGHGNFLFTLMDTPFEMLRFTARFLGSVMFHIFNNNFGKIISEIYGFFLIFIIFMSFFSAFIYKRIDDDLFKILIIYLLFIFISAFLISGGRVLFGLDNAFSSRYLTPSLFAQCAFLILLNIQYPAIQKKLFNFFILLIIFMLPTQINSFTNDVHKKTNYSLSALSLLLEVDDKNQQNIIYPNNIVLKKIAQRAKELNLSIFGSGDIYNLYKSLNQINSSDLKNSSCHGYLEEKVIIDDEFSYYKGWIYDNKLSGKYTMHAVDENNKNIGIGYYGLYRPDVKNAIKITNKFTGYKVYFKNDSVFNKIYFIINNRKCTLKSFINES